MSDFYKTLKGVSQGIYKEKMSKFIAIAQPAASADEAKALMEFSGFMFGIGGVLTYKKSTLPQVLPLIPMDRVVLETDCPYLSPVPFRGKRNEPSYIVNTAAVMAQTYGISADEVAQVTSANARRLFRL